MKKKTSILSVIFLSIFLSICGQVEYRIKTISTGIYVGDNVVSTQNREFIYLGTKLHSISVKTYNGDIEKLYVTYNDNKISVTNSSNMNVRELLFDNGIITTIDDRIQGRYECSYDKNDRISKLKINDNSNNYNKTITVSYKNREIKDISIKHMEDDQKRFLFKKDKNQITSIKIGSTEYVSKYKAGVIDNIIIKNRGRIKKQYEFVYNSLGQLINENFTEYFGEKMIVKKSQITYENIKGNYGLFYTMSNWELNLLFNQFTVTKYYPPKL